MSRALVVVALVLVAWGCPAQAAALGPVTLKPQQVAKPPTPTGVTAVRASSGVIVSWDKPKSMSTLSGYNIFRTEGPDGKATPLTRVPVPATSVSYTDAGASVSKGYSYTVAAISLQGLASELSAPATVAPRLVTRGKLAFTSQRDGNAEIYIMNADGSGQRNLTRSAGDDTQPAWSPDGNRIAFASTRNGLRNIFVMYADGFNPIALTGGTALCEAPRWSPDGTKLAYHTFVNGTAEIYMMNADGSGKTRVTNNSYNDFDPTWSADGRRLAFVTTRDGNSEVYTMNLDGSGAVNVTNHPALDSSPAWSAAQGRIAFTSTRNLSLGVFTMEADGTGVSAIGPGADPAWSPDGARLAITSYRDGNGEVYTLGIDGGNMVRLTTNSFNDLEAVWSPQ